MVSQNIYFQEEKRYVESRLLVLFVIIFFSFAFSTQVNSALASTMLLVKLILSGLAIVSLLHYFFMVKMPDKFVSYRKNFLIFADLIVLTLLIAVFEKYGLFLLPLYIIIVMHNGLIFGIKYFYTSIVLAAISWLLLLTYSEYWQLHYDILATFAMTTFLIPLFYLKFITRVHERNDELSGMLVSTEHEANYDVLTGIANRKMYKETIQKILNEDDFFALFFLDLNKFKVINDTYGHQMGDNVLIEVSRRLIKNIDEGDFLARLGGDEFVIITQRKKVFLAKFLEKLEKNVIGKYRVDGVTINIGLSIGVSLYPDDGQDEMTLGKHADEAMYAVKKKYNRTHMFYEDIGS
jgi:diguanylate cyclase (GGDEF)-like protein